MMKPHPILAVIVSALAFISGSNMTEAQENGVANKRPIMGAACRTCIWGPLAELTREAMAPYGYDVQICYNCNRSLSVPVVAERRETPPLNDWDIRLGDP